MSVQKTIARNTVFNALGRSWEAVLGIVVLAYIVDKLGDEGYGLWALVGSFTGYIALADFGVGSAFTKYIAEHAARKDESAVSAVVSTGLFFYTFLGLIIVGLGWPLVDVLIAGITRLLIFLHPQNAETYNAATTISDVRFLFRGALLLFCVSNCFASFSAVQSGLQRMGITNVISFCASIIKLVATVIFLENGFGVRGLLYTNALVLSVIVMLNVVAAFWLFPGLRVGLTQCRKQTLLVLMNFGWRTQVAKLSNLVNFQTDRVIVGLAFSNFALIGLYSRGEWVANKFRQLPALLMTALLPAVSDLDARDEHEKLAELYLRSTKYVAALIIPLAAFAIATADILFHAIFGDAVDSTMAAWVMRIILVGYVVNLLPGPGVSVALGKGRADLQMKAGLISMIANIALTILLVWQFGFYGIPVATALSLGLSTAWFFLEMRKHVAVSLRALVLTAVRWPTLAALPGFALCLVVNYFMQGMDHRIPNIAAVALCSTVFAIKYIALIRLTPFLDRFDVGFLKHTLHLKRLPGFEYLTRRAKDV
jgi:O-antigen/teichoic acid export membrane protein